MDPVFSIIIPTKNRAGLLRRFLPPLAEQDTKEPYEIIVVDNGSTDETPIVLAEMAAKYPHVRSIVETKSGSAAACHAGALAAEGPIICFFDDDMLAVPQFVAKHLEAHGANPGSCVLGQVLSAQGTHPFERMLAYIYDGPRLNADARQPEPSDYWSGNVSMPKEIYLRLGGYDQLFASLGYGKDVDFGMRLVENGIPMMFAIEALSYQHFNERFSDRLRKSYRSGITYGYVRENFPRLPIPVDAEQGVGIRDRLAEKFCRLAAVMIEPFDRGKGRPVLPLAFVYDLGLRIAVRRGMADYSSGKAKVNVPGKAER